MAKARGAGHCRDVCARPACGDGQVNHGGAFALLARDADGVAAEVDAEFLGELRQGDLQERELRGACCCVNGPGMKPSGLLSASPPVMHQGLQRKPNCVKRPMRVWPASGRRCGPRRGGAR
jgi:hypothetical protein